MPWCKHFWSGVGKNTVMGWVIQHPTVSEKGEKKHKERVSGPESAKSKKCWETGAHTAAHTAVWQSNDNYDNTTRSPARQLLKTRQLLDNEAVQLGESKSLSHMHRAILSLQAQGALHTSWPPQRKRHCPVLGWSCLGRHAMQTRL